MNKYIRGKQNGIILDYQERLAKNSLFEVVSEMEAYPERFAPVDLAKRDKKVDLEVPAEVAAAPNVAPPELIAEAERRFSKPRTTKVSTKTAGLKGEF